MPLSVPDAARECGGWEPFVLPERHNHAAVAWVGFESFNEALSELIAFDDPAIGGTDGMGIFFWIPFSALIFAVFGDFPFVPDFDAAFMEPANIVALLLINPKHFEDGGLEGNEFGSENWEFFGQVELKYLMRKTNSGRLKSALSSMVRNIAGCGLVFAFIGSCVVYDAFAIF